MGIRRCYIAGPITGYEVEGPDPYAERKAAWVKAELAVLEMGLEPMSPWNLHTTPIDWEDALRADLTGLVTCQAIYLLKGYASSRGAQLELSVARELGLHEIYEDHPETILEEAERIVSGDRGPQYGHPAANFVHTARLWSAYLGIEITAEQVPAMMILLKMSREKNRPKRDNLVDVAGYTKTWAMVNEARRKGELP